MHQPRTPPAKPPAKRYAEPEIASAAAVWRATLAVARTPAAAPHRHRPLDPRLETFGIVLLAPVFAAVTAVILVALLAIFVIWLYVVGMLFAGTVTADLVGRWWRRARFDGALDHRALGYPGR
jgi:hypothetical protein